MGVIKLCEYRRVEELKEKATKKYTIKDFLFFFDISLDDVAKLISFSERIKKQHQFILAHKKQFNTLTIREKEIFKRVVKGEKSSEIGEVLFIETATVSTHRKHIIEKLNLQSTYDWYKYAHAFDILQF